MTDDLSLSHPESHFELSPPSLTSNGFLNSEFTILVFVFQNSSRIPSMPVAFESLTFS
eukprot:m.168605 g.168605  ORF g.168605 m.168605 type:complete len:58 (+) comp38961_c0_seq7:116-289(+)